MFVIQSCQKIEYNALFMMIFIPVSNFGDQPLVVGNLIIFLFKSLVSELADTQYAEWDLNKK